MNIRNAYTDNKRFIVTYKATYPIFSGGESEAELKKHFRICLQ